MLQARGGRGRGYGRQGFSDEGGPYDAGSRGGRGGRGGGAGRGRGGAGGPAKTIQVQTADIDKVLSLKVRDQAAFESLLQRANSLGVTTELCALATMPPADSASACDGGLLCWVASTVGARALSG